MRHAGIRLRLTHHPAYRLEKLFAIARATAESVMKGIMEAGGAGASESWARNDFPCRCPVKIGTAGKSKLTERIRP